MPAPLIPVALATAKKAVSFVSRLTKTPAHKRAAKEVQSLLPRALAGDPIAIARLQQGAQFAGTNKAKAIFQAALDRVRAAGVITSQLAAPPPAPLPMGTPSPPGSEPDAPPTDSKKGIPWPLVFLGLGLVYLLTKKGG